MGISTLAAAMDSDAVTILFNNFFRLLMQSMNNLSIDFHRTVPCYSRVRADHIASALKTYGGCEQRYGK